MIEYTKERPLKVFEAFGGYGSQSLALKRLKQNFPEFDYKCVGYSDIDKAAIKAYFALHEGEDVVNYGDICTIDWNTVPDFDLFTYSFPCTDISNAGKQMGLGRDSGTRSSLLWECERAVEIKRPKYLLMENVKALLQKKFLKDFHAWLNILQNYGYYNAFQVLNAADYGVPQHRERIFLFSIRDDGDNPTFNFPKTIKLGKRLKDILETNVDDKYYLKEERIEGFDGKKMSVEEMVVLGWTRDSKGNIIDRHPVEEANCVTSGKRENTQNYVVEPQIVAMRGREPQVMTPKRKDNLVMEPMIYDDYNGRLRDDQDTCGTLTTNCGNEAPRNGFKIIEPINTDKDGNASCIRAGYYKAVAANFMEREDGYGQTAVVCQGYRIRKLTERECFRLMDVPEEYIDIIQQSGVSRSQQYKMAGNSIVVSCLYHIFRKAFIETENENSQLTLF